MNNEKITNLVVLFDVDANTNKKTYEKALVTRNGVTEEVIGDAAIREVIVALQVQEQKKISEIPSSICQIGRTKNRSAVDFYNKQKETLIAPIYVLNRAEATEAIKQAAIEEYKKEQEAKRGVKQGLAIAGTVVTLALFGLFADTALADMLNKEPAIENTIDDEKVKKENPVDWDSYVKDYEDSVQKEFLVNIMNNTLLPNLKEVEINDEKFQYGLTSEEAIFLMLYAEGNLYTNEEKIQILGKYAENLDLADMQKGYQNALMKMLLSVGLASDKEDVIVPEFKDELTNKLLEQYLDKIMAFKNAETKEEKDAIQAEVQDMLIKNFIDADLGKEDYVVTSEHPGTVAVILNTISKSTELYGLEIREDIKIMLNGQEAQVGFGEVEDKIGVRGTVDEACDYLNSEYESLKQYVDRLLIIDAVLGEDEVSEWDKLTENSFDFVYMTEMMDKELTKEHKLSDVVEMTGAYNDLTEEQLKESEFHPENNPAGGTVGDTYVEDTQNNVVLPPENTTPEENVATPPEEPPKVVVDNFTKEEIEDAQEKADQVIENDGDEDTITQDKFEELQQEAEAAKPSVPETKVEESTENKIDENLKDSIVDGNVSTNPDELEPPVEENNTPPVEENNTPSVEDTTSSEKEETSSPEVDDSTNKSEETEPETVPTPEMPEAPKNNPDHIITGVEEGKNMDFDNDGKSDGEYKGDSSQNPNQQGQDRENSKVETEALSYEDLMKQYGVNVSEESIPLPEDSVIKVEENIEAPTAENVEPSTEAMPDDSIANQETIVEETTAEQDATTNADTTEASSSVDLWYSSDEIVGDVSMDGSDAIIDFDAWIEAMSNPENYPEETQANQKTR